MKNIIKICSAGILLAVLGGCAQSNYKPLTIEIPENHNTAEIDLLITQHEIDKDIIVSNSAGAMGGGLIFALIDAGVNQSRAEDAEQEIQMLRNSVVDFDFDEMARTQIRSIFSANSEKLTFDDVQVLKEIGSLQESVQATEAAMVITMPITYALSADGRTLRVDFHTNIFAKNKEIYDQLAEQAAKKYEVADLDLKHSFYRNMLFVKQTLSDVDGLTVNQALERWAADDGKALKEGLTRAVNHGARIIVEDISRAKLQLPDPKYTKINTRHGEEVRGVLIEETEEVQVIKLANGFTHAYL